MIKIDKGSEPNSWMLIRRTPGMTYDAADKTDLRASLLKEQGFICGYCMRRVDAVNSRIEHLKPQSLSLRQGKLEETLDYSNMIVCCDGDINGSNAEMQFHCDRHKKETPISEIQLLLKNFTNKDANGQKKAYCGIVIWFLSSRLRHL